MPLPPRVVTRLAILATVLSAAIALLDAASMQDRVRLVDILTLFFGGAGTGAGLAVLVAQRRAPREPRADPAPRSETPPGRVG